MAAVSRANMASRGISESKDSASYHLTWNCRVDEFNSAFIERYCLNLAKEENLQRIAVRAGVHNTFIQKFRTGDGMGKGRRTGPWHFTIELKTKEGKYRNAHIYVDISKVMHNDHGDDIGVASGISAVGEELSENPEFFEEQAHSSAKAIRETSTLKMSYSNMVIQMSVKAPSKLRL